MQRLFSFDESSRFVSLGSKARENIQASAICITGLTRISLPFDIEIADDETKYEDQIAVIVLQIDQDDNGTSVDKDNNGIERVKQDLSVERVTMSQGGVLSIRFNRPIIVP